MTLTAQDFDDAVMRGEAMFEEWRAQFEQEWNEPHERQALLIALSQMPPEQLQEMLLGANPEYLLNNAANNAVAGGSYGRG